MIEGKSVQVRSLKKDRCSRTGHARVGRKAFLFPAIAPRLTSKLDWSAYIESRTSHPSATSQAGIMVIRSIDLPATLAPVLKSYGQTTLGGQAAYGPTRDVIDATPLMIDPCTDYLLYKSHQKSLANDPNAASDIRKMAEKMLGRPRDRKQRGIADGDHDQGRLQMHGELWRSLLQNNSVASSIVSTTLAAQDKHGADIVLPPAPAIHDQATLEASAKINRLARAVRPDGSCANYNIITPTALVDERIVDKLLGYISSVDDKFNVLKFKNHTLERPSNVYQRSVLKKVLESINEIKSRSPDRAFVLLEAGSAMYAAAAGGFDVVSSSMTGFDHDGVGYTRGGSGHGGYFSPRHLVTLQWRDAKRMIEGGGLPCGCEICSRITAIPLQGEWNVQRRLHYVQCTSRLLADLARFVDEQKIELAKQRLFQSALSNFAPTLPYIV